MRRYRSLLLVFGLVAGAAFAAIAVGQKIFVKSKNTRLLKAPELTSANVATLQPGEEVTWIKKEGSDFHQVTAGRKTGFIYFANLSLKKPEPEYLRGVGTGAVDPQAFASSGAATKALGPGPIAYGEKKLNDPNAVSNVVALEALAKQITAEDVQKFARARGVVAPLMADKPMAVKQ